MNKTDDVFTEDEIACCLQEFIIETKLIPIVFLGKMFPTQGDLHVAPFTDETLYMEQCSKANFWSVNIRNLIHY